MKNNKDKEVRIPGPKPWFIEVVNARGAMTQHWHEWRADWLSELAARRRDKAIHQRITAKYGAIVVYEERDTVIIKDNLHLNTWDI